jgi:CheY-like chemotaxis protein
VIARCVLVVDDDEEQRDAAALVLVEAGHQVLIADSGDEALRTLRALSPHKCCVVLTDLHMPRMDGRQLTLRIRQQIHDWRVRVVIGAHAVTSTDLRGADGFLQKPYWPDQLREEIALQLSSFEDSDHVAMR